MALSIGTHVGPYEILAPLGAGGMGEVYRARDTKLSRDVALKILPEAFTLDGDRIARFRREAQVLASLNHPNIAAIYGFEDSGRTHALVLELVEGPTLADRIAQGAIPLDDALPIARQIAEALEAAHEQGIIHRDLKPANIKVRADGTVKVLDFGLAKLADAPAVSGAGLSQSPTITSPAMTQLGVILGTAAYMSPEQASGKPVDKRADIWAFGVVLWEMLTGNRLFDGETISHTLALILTKEPDWSQLSATTPEPLRRLLRRCLEKATRRRLADIADVRFELDEAALARENVVNVESEINGRRSAGRARRDRALGFVAGLMLAVGAGYGWFGLRPAPASPQVRFTIGPNAGQSIQISNFDRDMVISPDGTKIVYVSIDGGGRRHLMVRPIDSLMATPIHDIGSATIAVSVFVSPDSRWVGFFEGDEIKKISITGGPAIPVCKFQGNPRGASWGTDNTIVFATNAGLRRVPAAGGDAEVVTTPDRQAGETGHLFPAVLPDGQSALFVIATSDRANVALVDLRTHKYKVVIPGGNQAIVLPTGHIAYPSAGTLLVVGFDPKRKEVSGDPVPVLEQVMTARTFAANFDVSNDGTMAFMSGVANQTARRSLVWVDRQGHEDPLNVPPRPYVSPRLSPDGKRIAVDIRDEQEDIYVWDLGRQMLTRLTLDPRLDEHPVWTSDSRRIVFTSQRSGRPNVFWQSADGTGTVEQLTSNDAQRGPRPFTSASSLAPDGSLLLDGPTASGSAIVVMSLAAGATAAANSRDSLKPLIEGAVNVRNAEVSPDGRWIAYQSNESNQPQIYVRPFPNVEGGKWQVSTAGGIKPVWAHSGHEVFFIDAADALVSVSIEASGSTLVHGNPTKIVDAGRYLVRSAFNARTYDVSLDAQRFLMVKDIGAGDSASPSSSPAITVVLNWMEELKKRVPAK